MPSEKCLLLVYKKTRKYIVEMRNTKNFDEEKFIAELLKHHWEYVLSIFFSGDTNAMWEIWKKFFLEVLDKHAPLQYKIIRSKKIPWITSEIKNL